MFWPKKNSKKNKNNKNTDKRTKEGTGTDNVSVGTTKGQRTGQNTKSEEIRAEALANVRAAHDHIGEETLERFAALINQAEQPNQKSPSPADQARALIKAAGKDSVLYRLKGSINN